MKRTVELTGKAIVSFRKVIKGAEDYDVDALLASNAQRSAVVSRRDNNDMWAMAEKLEAIAKRISKMYP